VRDSCASRASAVRTSSSCSRGRAHRAARDLDLLGFGDPSEEQLRDVFAEVVASDAGDDGVRFDGGSLDVGPDP
jgi:hypothetical protein